MSINKLLRNAFLILSLALASSAIAQTTVTLQQGLNGYAGAADSFVDGDFPDQSQGANSLALRSETSQSMMVRFKIFAAEGGPVPNGATITSATLSFYKFLGADAVIKASRLLKNWSEAQATWNVVATGTPWTTPGALSAGNDYLATADGQASVGDAGANGCDVFGGGPYPAACFLHIDVTSGVQAFSANPASNFGWKLAQVSSSLPDNHKHFISKEESNYPTVFPKLTITYTTTPPSTTILQQGLNGYAGAADSFVDGDFPDQSQGANSLALRSETSQSMMVRFKIFAAEGGPVPNGATITSATLSFYKFLGADAVIKASRLLKNWSEAQATWNVVATGTPWTTPGAQSAGNDYLAAADGQASVGDAGANGCDVFGGGPYPAACFLHIDVTSGVQAFAANPGSNFGWKLAQVSSSLPDNHKHFISKEEINYPTVFPKLTITWSGGSTTPTVPTAALTATPSSGQPPLNVTFSASGSADNGSPITGLRLAFGDGTTDATWTDKNLTQSHTYNAAGSYTATLTATNANGTSAPVTTTITVTSGPVPPTAQLTATPSFGPAPLTVTFSAPGSTQGSAPITSLSLQFGDNLQEVTWADKTVTQSHSYPAGTYTATLTVTDANGLSNSNAVQVSTGSPRSCGAGVDLCVNFEDTLFDTPRMNPPPRAQIPHITTASKGPDLAITPDGTDIVWEVENKGNCSDPSIAACGDRLRLVPGGGRDGGSALWIATLDNDLGVQSTTQERSEIHTTNEVIKGVPGNVQWWAHSVYFPAGSVVEPQGTSVLQFHAGQDPFTCPDLSCTAPPFILAIQPEEGNPTRMIWRAFSAGTSATNSTGVDAIHGQYDYFVVNNSRRSGQCLSADYIPNEGAWYDFVHHIKWSYTNDGFHEIWMRKTTPGQVPGPVKKVMSRTGINTLYLDGSVELKLGVYHAPVAGNTSVVVDRIRRSSLLGADGANAVRMPDFVMDLNASVTNPDGTLVGCPGDRP